MKKEQAEKMQNQIATLIRANAKLKADFDAYKLEAESMKTVEGASAPNTAAMIKARQCFHAGDVNGAVRHLIGG